MSSTFLDWQASDSTDSMPRPFLCAIRCRLTSRPVAPVVAFSLVIAGIAVGQTSTSTAPPAASSAPDSQLNARVRWLADNSFPVRSIDPEDADFGDLRFLNKIIGNARV